MQNKNSLNAYVFLFSFFNDLAFIYGFYNNMFVAYGMSLTQVSFLLAISQSVKLSADIFTGMFADMFGRKLSLRIALVLRIILMLLWFFYKTKQSFFFGIILWGLSGSFLSGKAEAYIYDQLLYKNTVKKFPVYLGWYYVVSNLAIASSAFFGARLFNFGSFDIILLSSLISFTIGFLITYFMPQDVILSSLRKNYKTIIKSFASFISVSNVQVKKIIILAILSESLFFLFLDLNTLTMTSLSLNVKTIAYVVAFISVVKVITNAIAGYISSFFSFKRIAFLMITYAVFFTVSAYCYNMSLVLMISLYIIIYSFTDIALKSIIQEHIQSEIRSTVLSSMSLISTIIILLINVVIGIIAKSYDYKTSLITIGLLITLVLLSIIKKPRTSA